MQSIWIEDLKKAILKDSIQKDLEKYSFDEEWTVGDCEQSPLCQIIWGTIIAKYFNDKNPAEPFEFHINRNWMTVSNNETSYRFLFDVMNNPKHNVGRDNPYEYHLIGNFAPIPGNTNQKPSLQFIHRGCGERWELFLDYMHDNWDSFKMGFSFKEYIKMTCQDMYFANGKRKELNDSALIKELIMERGKIVSDRFMEIFNNPFEKFKALFDAVSWEEEYEIFFSDIDKTYMIIKYDDHVSFQRCGANDGSGEYNYDSLMELYQTESVDGICLEKDWDKITAIVADAMFDITDEEELADYKNWISARLEK